MDELKFKVGDKVRILVDGYCGIEGAKIGHIFTVSESYPEISQFLASCPDVEDDMYFHFSNADCSTGWEFVEEKAAVDAPKQQLSDSLPLPPAKVQYVDRELQTLPSPEKNKRLKFGRRRMAFEFAKAICANHGLMEAFDDVEHVAKTADEIALALIARWKSEEPKPEVTP